MKRLRTILKIVVYILALPVLLLLIWLIYNHIDEAPTAEALGLAEPYSSTLPDEQNAWLYLVGIGAAADTDPIALGRRRVDAYAARIAQRPIPAASSADLALFQDPIAYVANAGAESALCPDRKTDCIAWARAERSALDQLAEQNKVLLQRYETVLGMSAFEEIPTPSQAEPSLEISTAHRIDELHVNLIARDLAAGASPIQAAEKLERAAIFWRRADQQARSPDLKLIAIRRIERYQRLLDRIVDRASVDQLAALQVHADLVLAEPTVAQRDWRLVTKYQYQLFDNYVGSEMGGTWAVLEECMAGSTDSCFKDLMMRQAYAPQATRNLLLRHYLDSESFLNSDPRDYHAESSKLGAIRQRTMPLGDVENGATLMAYNMTGKVLAFIALPAMYWVPRSHDAEALRRMLVIKLDAKRAGVKPAEMAEWLAQQPDQLRNPYSGEAFGWNAQLREISFEPQAVSYWEKDWTNVAYRDRRERLVGDCDAPPEGTRWRQANTPMLLLDVPSASKEREIDGVDSRATEYLVKDLKIRVGSGLKGGDAASDQDEPLGGGQAVVDTRFARHGAGRVRVAWHVVGQSEIFGTTLTIEFANAAQQVIACNIVASARLHAPASELTLTQIEASGAVPFALLKNAEGQEFRVTKDSYATRDQGVVTTIEAGHIEIIELHPTDSGGWMEVPVRLDLASPDSANGETKP